MAREKTVVVLGGGVSGLTAGGALARRGYRVCLLEANGKVGGCCGGTSVGGYTFNDVAVFLLMRSVLERVFERLGLDREELLPLKRVTANSTTWLPDGSVVTHGDGLELSVEGGPHPFDGSRTQEELAGLVRSWAPLYRTMTQDLIFQPPSALRMLSRAWRYLPPGGMGRIPQALARAVPRHGGEIHLDARAERIIVERGRVRGVEIEGQGRIEADAVISTVSGMLTFCRLLDESVVPPALARKARSARLSQRSVNVQLGLRNRLTARSLNLSVLPPMEEHQRYFASDTREREWLAWSVPTAVDPTLAPQGGSVVEVFPPIEQQVPLSDWSDRRTAEVVQSTLDLRGRHHPLSLFPCRTGISGLCLAVQTTFPGYSVPPVAVSGLHAAAAVEEDLAGTRAAAA